MKLHEIPGHLELVFEVPALTDDQRAEIAAYVIPGWQGMGECRSVADDSCSPTPVRPPPPHSTAARSARSAGPAWLPPSRATRSTA